jgi:hypothetical protein
VAEVLRDDAGACSIEVTRAEQSTERRGSPASLWLYRNSCVRIDGLLWPNLDSSESTHYGSWSTASLISHFSMIPLKRLLESALSHQRSGWQLLSLGCIRCGVTPL